MNMREKVEKIAFESGEIDLFGVAPASRLSGAPEGSRPEEIIPQAKSIISLGIKLGQGIRKANRSAYAGHPHAIYTYHTFGLSVPGSFLESNAYRIVRSLEKEGYATVCIPHAYPSDRFKLMGAVSHRHSAVAAGLGEFGLNGLLITPDSGCMVRLITIVTEADMEPNPMYSGEPICRGDKCLICAEACPMHAFDPKAKVELKIGDKQFFYLKFKKWRCCFGTYGKRKISLGRSDCTMPEEPGPEDFARAVAQEDIFQKLEGVATSRCGKCLIECPVGSSQP